MIYVKVLKAYGSLLTVTDTINDWIDMAHNKSAGFTVISVTIQQLIETYDTWTCIAVIEYRNDTAIQE